MPRTTVYIRNEDWDAWKALENKSQTISDLLRGRAAFEDYMKLPGVSRSIETEKICPIHGTSVSVCALMKH